MFHRDLLFQVLYDSGDPSTGAATSTDTGADGNTGNPPTATGTSPVIDGKTADEKPSTFTQEQFDSAIANRLKRERETILKELGVDDIEAAKAALQAKKDAEEAQKTEAQKLADQLQAEKDKATALEQQIADMKTARIHDLRNTAIKDVAQKLSAVDVEDVLLNVMKDAEALAKLVDDEGNVKADAIQTAVEKVRSDKPHLFSKQIPGTPSNRTGTAPNPDKKALDAAYEQHKRRVRRR